MLNEDFNAENTDFGNVSAEFTSIAANPEISFKLAEIDPYGNPTCGITRHQMTGIWAKTFKRDLVEISINNDVKKPTIWDSEKYLNIWVIDGVDPSEYQGNGTFPGGDPSLDGVVVIHERFGTIGTAGSNIYSRYDLGRTATHEVGHWLNLFHIFNDDCNGSSPSNCLTGGDRVCDTPQSLKPPASQSITCPNRNTCTENPNLEVKDIDENYMSYAGIDACQFMFTEGQKTRMYSTLNGVRAAIVEKNLITPLAVTDIVHNGSFCTGSYYEFEAISNQIHSTYLWFIEHATGTITQSTSTNKVTGTFPFTNIGDEIKVTVVVDNVCNPTGSEYVKTFTIDNSLTAIPQPEIITPSGYCANRNNTFELNPATITPNVIYEWNLVGLKGADPYDESATGVDMTTFSPDFGFQDGNLQLVCDNGVEVYGDVSEFTLTVTVSNCSGSSTSAPFTDSDVDYTYQGCCGTGSSTHPHPQIGTGDNPIVDGVFIIELLPNPAQDRVTVKFNRGGGETKNVRIVDAYGVERKNVNTNSAAQQINVSDLPLGVYTVIATKNTEVATEHLQIQP